MPFRPCACAGKLFSFELLDAQGGEIRGCGFNQCVDKFEPIMQQGAVIMLSKASLKNKRPNSVSISCNPRSCPPGHWCAVSSALAGH